MNHDFAWAVEQLKDRRYVRRQSWPTGTYITVAQLATVRAADEAATDWELFPLLAK